MSLRAKSYLYLVAVHVVFLTVSAFALHERPFWLLGVELVFAGSLYLGIRYVRRNLEPLDLLRSGASFLREEDFGVRLRDVGQQELDELVHLYNDMAGRLRDERIHNAEQEKFYRGVLEESPTAVLALDLDRRIALVNAAACRLLGQTERELLGKTLGEVQTPAAGALSGIPLGQTRLLTVQGRHRLRCRRGSYLDRGFQREFFVAEEFTAEYHLAERRAYEKLIRVMSHEVNNTTGSVSSLLQSCATYGRQLDSEDRRDFERALEVAVARNTALNAFMRGFADVVRLPSPRLEPVDLAEVCRRTAKLFEVEAAKRSIDLRLEFDREEMTLPCDPVQIEQAILNIVKNAMEAVGSGGTIRIHGCTTGQRWALDIFDSGPGIAPEARDHLFTSFFSTKENGQGIGLTLVREILAAHGYDFSLERVEQEETRFRIVFPLPGPRQP